ncbi:hypothetical protein SteCoe_19709 [Stentor coeruleus]|uniref:DUF4201 domain-containing protein n=1 Tax=Stentor coeruleus TaxID=5963 RepID=A0A1R2BTU0_9CILI|nr:hypothetical protein SteCoe_19709 [Stentor coeruleus]
MSVKSKFMYDDKLELIALQKENISIRNQLKELGSKLNNHIELRDIKKLQTKSFNTHPEEELKEANKLIDIYKKEKSFLARKVKKAIDLDYLNSLVKQVDKLQLVLTESENSRKITELYERKEQRYRMSPIKTPDISMEIDYLSSKKQHYIDKISKLQDSIDKKKKMIIEANKKHDDLEKKHKNLISELGESYFKEKSLKQIMGIMSKKEKIRSVIAKETNSKVNSMIYKIKTLQSELKILKDNENELNNQYLESLRKSEKFHESIAFLQYSEPF